MELFVFPLGHVVFYPSIAKPLHIFEPRYIQMIQDSQSTGTPIAIGYVDEPDRDYKLESGAPLSFVRPIVGYGTPIILEQRMDGSLGVFLQGAGKARLGKVLERKVPYIVCEAEPIQENHNIDMSQAVHFMTINKVLVSWVNTHIQDQVQREHFLKNIRSAEEVIGCFASYIVADHDMQQLILESNDINEKIDLVSGLIRSGELA